MTRVTVYTTHQQTEQGIEHRHVTALVVVEGLLTIECEQKERNHSFSAFHRYERGEWTRFEVTDSIPRGQSG